MTALQILWPLSNYNLQDDGFGNLVFVPALAWSAARYFAYGV